MSKKWTEEEDKKLVYDYEHSVMPYLASRLSVISKKYGVAYNYEQFQEDNERMLELMKQGISLITNASEIRRIMRQLDPEKCIETIGKVGEEPPETDPEELKEETIDEILEDYSDDYGLGNVGYNKLYEIDRDCFEWAGDLGKQRTLFIELYCMAFRLAVKDLERQGIHEV